jgi:hypothetical protein
VPVSCSALDGAWVEDSEGVKPVESTARGIVDICRALFSRFEANLGDEELGAEGIEVGDTDDISGCGDCLPFPPPFAESQAARASGLTGHDSASAWVFASPPAI